VEERGEKERRGRRQGQKRKKKENEKEMTVRNLKPKLGATSSFKQYAPTILAMMAMMENVEFPDPLSN